MKVIIENIIRHIISPIDDSEWEAIIKYVDARAKSIPSSMQEQIASKIREESPLPAAVKNLRKKIENILVNKKSTILLYLIRISLSDSK